MTRNPFRFVRRQPTRLLISCALVLTASIAAGPQPSRKGDFTLQARVLVAMENGPVAIEATGVYEGKGPLVVHSFAGQDGFVVDWQPKWRQEFNIRNSSYCGCPYGQETLVTGQARTAAKFLHPDYSSIPPGKVKLRLRWPVYEPGEYGKQVSRLEQFLESPRQVFRDGFRTGGPRDFVIGKLIALPETVVLVDVAPATPENLAALRNRFEKELDRPDITPQRAEFIAGCVIHTRHKELVSVVLKLFDCAAAKPDHRIIDEVHHSHPDPNEGNDFLLQYVVRPDALRPLIPFPYPSWKYHSFTDEQILALRDAKNPRVRMATCVTFPKQCPEKWQADLLAEMSNLAKLPATVENLRLLDDPNFPVREQATARLQALEDLAEPAIRAYLKGPVSLEARRRCEQILADLQANKRDFNASAALSILENASGPEGKAMLEALARNPPGCRVAEKAKEALDRLAQSAGQPK